MDSEKTTEQPITDSGVNTEQPSNTGIDKVALPDGTEVDIDELKNWYLRQSDYTKKAQALAEERKKLDTPENEEAAKTKQILKEMGFATVDELVELKKFKEETLTEKQKLAADKEFNDFANQFDELNDNHKKIIKDLKKVYSDKSYDEILKETGFIDEAKLSQAKSKQWLPVGASLWVSSKKEEVVQPRPEVMKKFGLKPSSEISDIRSQFWL